jgi:hypothetical protein
MARTKASARVKLRTRDAILNDCIVAVITLQHKKDRSLGDVVLYRGDQSVNSKLRFLALVLRRSDDPVVLDYVGDMVKVVNSIKLRPDLPSLWDTLDKEATYVESRVNERECTE